MQNVGNGTRALRDIHEMQDNRKRTCVPCARNPSNRPTTQKPILIGFLRTTCTPKLMSVEEARSMDATIMRRAACRAEGMERGWGGGGGGR